MSSFFGMIFSLVFLAVIILFIIFIWNTLKQFDENAIKNGEKANTFKFRSVVYILIAVFGFMTIFGAIIFAYLAYRSYHAGIPADQPAFQPVPTPVSNAQALGELHKLLSSGAITQEEYDVQKKKLLN